MPTLRQQPRLHRWREKHDLLNARRERLANLLIAPCKGRAKRLPAAL